MPLLTVITRTMPGREQWLERNVASWKAQTDQDYEQLILLDENPKWDMLRADVNLKEANGSINGRYVYVLDDDDYLIDKEFVASLKEVVAQNHHPEVIMVKFRRDAIFHDVLPTRWEQDPFHGDVGTPNFVVQKGVWLSYVWLFGMEVNRGFGDFAFINNVFGFGASVYWLDRVVAVVDHIGSAEH